MASLVEEKVRQMYLDELIPRDTKRDNLVKRGQVLTTTTQATLEKYAHYAGAAYVVTSKAWDCAISCQYADTAGTVVYHQWADTVDANVGYLAYKENTKEIIIGFRGSQTLFDWITNADFGKDSWPSSVSGSEVHSGFLDAHNAQASTIQSKIAELVAKYPTFNIVFVGHSLGGALAAIGAADLAPRVPPQGFGYAHHSQEAWYPSSGGLKFCGANGESSGCINSVSIFSLSTADHSDYPGLAH
ncbi:hypothetical protein FBU59_001614 [Linderina macrospora]|uniref:Uncharacterized protein n=1 Tax=Linderina macrospora TaxID=4868 RepID=A0ACC1JDC3_9FUNG|nr:hypothetical protein FBU59_001614 [Linderina macrospora]